MIDKPDEALMRLKEALHGHRNTCAYIQFMVAMVDGSPLYVALRDKDDKTLEEFEIIHPRWWGEMEIDGECFRNIQIVFATIKVILKGLGKSGRQIANNKSMYGWTYEIK